MKYIKIILALFFIEFIAFSQEQFLTNSEQLNVNFIAENQYLDMLANQVLNCHAELEIVLGQKAIVKRDPIYFTYNKLAPEGKYAVCLSSYMSHEECLYKIIQALLLRDFCPTNVDRFSFEKLIELDWLIAAVSHKIMHGNFMGKYTIMPHPYRLFSFYSCQTPFDVDFWIQHPVKATPLMTYYVYGLNSLYLARYLRVKVAPDAISQWLKEWGKREELKNINNKIFYRSEEKNKKILFNLNMRSFLFSNAAITNLELKEIVDEIDLKLRWCQENPESNLLSFLTQEIRNSIGNIALNNFYGLELQKKIVTYRDVVFLLSRDLQNEKLQKKYQKELKKAQKFIKEQEKVSQYLNKYENENLPSSLRFFNFLRNLMEIENDKVSNYSNIDYYLNEVEKKTLK